VSGGWDKLRASLILLFAVTAPWDVFLFVPGLGVRLPWLLALCIIALEFADFLYTRRIGIRFELLWPACALLILALPPVRIVPAQGAMAVLLGLAAARSVGPLLARDVVAALAFSIAPLALYTVVFFFLQLGAPALSPAPFAYSLQTGLSTPFGHTIMECALLLFVGFAAACSRFIHTNSTSRFMQWAPLVAAFPLGVALSALVTLSLDHIYLWRPPDYLISGGRTLAALLGGWLLARIIAKSYIHWREMRFTISEDNVNILAGLAIFVLLFPVEFRLLWGFLPGIAAGAAQCRKDLAPPPWLWAFGLIAVVILVLINVGDVHPADMRNPRNYETAAVEDFAKENYERLETRMDYFETYWPEERRTHLWRARVALARGLLHETAYEIAFACEPTSETELLLPSPPPEEVEAFLIRLRDACSQSKAKTATLAHIQGLLGAGKFKHAEALLEQALGESESVTLPEALDPDLETAAHGCPCSWPFREAVLQTVWPLDMQRPAELDALVPEDRAGAQWLRLLISWGAELRTAPAGFPQESLPLICVAKCHRSSAELGCISNGAFLARTDELVDPSLCYNPRKRYSAFELASEAFAAWRALEKPSSDPWTVMLEVQATAVATARFQKGIVLESMPPQETLRVPDVPIISIWL